MKHHIDTGLGLPSIRNDIKMNGKKFLKMNGLTLPLPSSVTAADTACMMNDSRELPVMGIL